MRKMVMGTLVVAGAAALLFFGAGLSAKAPKDSADEIRVFVLDKSGMAVDVKSWTGAIDVTPENGTRKAFRLDPAAPGLKEAYGEQKDAAKEKFGGAKGEGQSKMTASKDMICGQVKKLDDWWVEMIVVPAGSGKKADDSKATGAGMAHDHQGPYFKAKVDEPALKDPKTGAVHFSATVVFTMPNGDTKYVKGFEYPAGVYEDSLGRLIDKEFKDTSKLDHDQAAAAAHKIQTTLHGLPALSFKSDSDRQEFDKAKDDCMAACQRLEQATGKDIANAADKCKSALKEVRSQAKDAQGALTAE